MKGPGGYFEVKFEAVFGGPARNESRNYWIKREGAEPVFVPDVSRFGEKDKATGQQNWEDVPAGSALEGLLLPTPPGKDYRLFKVVTQPATADQISRLGNDRAPIVRLQWCRLDYSEYPPQAVPVWTTDGEAIRGGKWTAPEPGCPLEEGGWADVEGRPIAVTHWLPMEMSPIALPALPIPRRPARGGIVGYRVDE